MRVKNNLRTNCNFLKSNDKKTASSEAVFSRLKDPVAPAELLHRVRQGSYGNRYMSDMRALFRWRHWSAANQCRFIWSIPLTIKSVFLRIYSSVFHGNLEVPKHFIMKKKSIQLNKKLIFSKTNIASLNAEEQESLAGGAITGTQNTCVLAACGNMTINLTCAIQCRTVAPTCTASRHPITPICLPA